MTSFEVATQSLSRRYFYAKLFENYFNVSNNILPLFVVEEKIDGAKRVSPHVDSCQRYYHIIRGILCLVESAYKAACFLKEKQLMIFLRVLQANSCFS